MACISSVCWQHLPGMEAVIGVTPDPTITPTVQPPNAPTPTPDTPGDVNSDGVVDIVDAILVTQHFMQYWGLPRANAYDTIYLLSGFCPDQ